MYPSINLTKSIPIVVDFIKLHLDKIDNFGLSEEQLSNGLSILCYNYEIEFNNIVYKQIKGVPMGTPFAPPFSIIYLNHIEQTALIKLEEIGILPKIFVRYIDDILFGIIEINEDSCQKILNCFNNIDLDIQFTLEKPNINGYISYLDVNIRFNDTCMIEYNWYHKEFNSGLCLNNRSYIPSNMKSNFIENRILDVKRRCNTTENRNKSLTSIKNILLNNGHKFNMDKCLSKNKNKYTKIEQQQLTYT